MVRKGRLWICLSSLFLVAWPVSAQIRTSLKFSADETSSAKKTTFNANVKLGAVPAVLWREPSDLKTRDLFYGPGGSGHQPAGKLSFVEEKFSGAHPKFDIQDESGIRWGVKLGNEARPETAATRLVWAVGYFTNEDYYVPELKFPEAVRLSRGQHLVNNGKVKGARLKRHNTGEREIADWSWDDNPFVGTRELDGLKIMMEIICNTDLKKANQHVYDIEGKETAVYRGGPGSELRQGWQDIAHPQPGGP